MKLVTAQSTTALERIVRIEQQLAMLLQALSVSGVLPPTLQPPGADDFHDEPLPELPDSPSLSDTEEGMQVDLEVHKRPATASPMILCLWPNDNMCLLIL
eukprot:1289435-Amphidinium_carterae.3